MQDFSPALTSFTLISLLSPICILQTLISISVLLFFESSSAWLIHYTKYRQPYSRKRSVSREEVICTNFCSLFLVKMEFTMVSCGHKLIDLIMIQTGRMLMIGSQNFIQKGLHVKSF